MYTVFCDETGNSGSRYFSPEQPVYAEGGWFVPNGKITELEAAVLELELDHGYVPQSKGTRLKDSREGREYMAAVLERVAGSAIPFFYLVEKKYFICAKAVGTFFDPNFNPLVNPEEATHPDIRKLRAELLYAAPDEILLDFAEAFRDQDAARLVEVGKRWANALAAAGQSGLAVQLRYSLPNLHRNMEGEFAGYNKLNLPRGWDSLNAPSFAQAVQLMEQAGRPCSLVHDECATLEAAFRFFFARYSEAERRIFPRQDGSIEIFGFRCLRSLAFADSELSPLIRASDYLLANCVDFTRRALAGAAIPDATRKSAGHGLARMMHEALGLPPPAFASRQIGELMAADVWIAPVAKAFVGTSG